MSVPSFPISQERLSKVLRSEFELWAHNFGQRPVPESQDLRAFFIQWFAVFAPECFERQFVEEICTFAGETRQHVDFYRRKWYESLPIEVALYALRLDPYWISIAQSNLNHHNWGLRTFVLESLLLVVDKLRFDDIDLLASVTHSLESWHMGSEDAVLFLSMAQGDPKTKKTQIKQWLDRGEMSPQACERLQEFSSGQLVPNPFLYYINRIARYVLLRLACHDIPLQPLLFPEIPDKQSSIVADELQLELPIVSVENPSDLGAAIWQRMNNHPIFQPFIELGEAAA